MTRFEPPPARATRILLFVCVGVQLIAILMGPAFDASLALRFGLIPARLTGEVVGLDMGTTPLLTLFTYIFLHAGILHLAMNMVFLAWVGRHVEWLLGPWHLLFLFLLSGIAGGVLQVASDSASLVPVVGASGAVSGVFAAYALLFARQGEAPASIFGFRLSGETVQAMRYAALWIGLQLLVAVAFNLPGAGPGGGIAIWTHIGGFIVGLVYAAPWARGLARTRE
ncbi:MAG: rhomboid family intramembrane serine protease [Thermaurantiacus sp.]